jgi:hypothetical protein
VAKIRCSVVPELDPVGDPRQEQAAQEPGEAGHAHQPAGPGRAQHRLGELDLVGEEADLGDQPEREADRDAPEGERPERLCASPGRRRRGHCAGSRLW